MDRVLSGTGKEKAAEVHLLLFRIYSMKTAVYTVHLFFRFYCQVILIPFEKYQESSLL